MKEKDNQIINACLNDNKTQEYYSNIIKKRYKYTLHLFAKARCTYIEYNSSKYVKCDLPITSKNYSPETIQKKLFEKDYSVPDNFISLLDHLLVLNLTYKMLVDKDFPSDKERIQAFVTVDRVLHLLVEKVSWFTGYFQALSVNEGEMSKLRQAGVVKKTAKIKQDCVEAYRVISPEDRSTLKDHWIAEKTIPKILEKKYGYTSIKEARELKKNGRKKPEWTVPAINTILKHIKDELQQERTSQYLRKNELNLK